MGRKELLQTLSKAYRLAPKLLNIRELICIRKRKELLQVSLIGLHSQRNNLPLILCNHVLDDLLQAITDGANGHFPASLQTPDKMVEKQMNRLRFMDVLVFHVDSIRWKYILYQHMPLHPSPK